MTLRRRLTAAFVLVVALPLLVAALLLSHVLPRQAQRSQQQSLTVAARSSSMVLRTQCAVLRATAQTAARVTAQAAATPGGTPVAALRDLVAPTAGTGVAVRDAAGRLVAGAGDVPTAPVDCGAPDAARAVALPAALTAVVPLQTPGGGSAGTAVASRPLDRLRLGDLSAPGTLAVLTGDGRVVVGGPLPAPVLRAVSRVAAAGVGVTGGVVWAVQPAAGLRVLIMQRAERGPHLVLPTLLLLLVAVAAASALAVIVARATTRPLAELSEAASRVAEGDLGTVIEVHSRDEVGDLASSFNAMTTALQGSVGALQLSHEELRASLARLGDTLSSTHDLDRILVVVLEAAAAAVGARSGRVLLLSPDRRELVRAASTGDQTVLADTVPVGEGPAGRVALSGEAELLDGSALVVPLVSSGTVIGVLELLPAVGTTFGKDHLVTVRTFAGQAAVAVDNVLLHQEAQRLSLTDGLTGLWNFRYFSMTLAKEIERAARFGRPVALLMLDLDHFKAVNDTWGHQRGDSVLIELAARVRGQVRDVDTVARYGGEEVVVVLPETDEDGAVALAQRVCGAVGLAPFGSSQEAPVAVTVSVGVAVFPGHGSSAALLLAAADRALYVAKSSGRNTWRLAVAGPEDGPDVGVEDEPTGERREPGPVH